MKNLLPALLAVALLAPAARASYVDAKSQKVLADSAWAYGSMTNMKVRFSARSYSGGTVQGQFYFSAPNLVRLDRQTRTGTLRSVTNNASLYEQLNAKTYHQEPAQGMPGAVSQVWRRVPSQVHTLLGPLLLGQTPAGNFEYQKMKVTYHRSGGYDVLRATGSPAYGQWEMRFGTKDHLLYRLDWRMRGGRGMTGNSTTLSAYQKDKGFPNGTFAFKPGKGMKKLVAVRPQPAEQRFKVGAKPPALYGVDINGKRRNLSDYKGKVVLVDFWATWCGPCIAEMPGIKAAYKKYHSRGFEILAVSLDNDKSELVKYIKQNKMPWPQLLSKERGNEANVKRYGVTGIPFSILVGMDGRIVAVDPRGPLLEREMSKLMRGWI